MKKALITTLLLISNIFGQNNDPLYVAKKISDRVINETLFELTDTDQKPVIDLQVIDFTKILKHTKGDLSFALAKIEISDNKQLQFGISYSSPVDVWVNDELVFQGRLGRKFEFKEIAYSVFEFQDTFTVKLTKQLNRIVVGSLSADKSIVYLREITEPEQPALSKFLSLDPQGTRNTWLWRYFSIKKEKKGINYPEKSLMDGLFNGNTESNTKYNVSPAVMLKKLVTNPNSTFKKDSYADWNYPNGTLIMSIMKLFEYTTEQRFGEFVKKYCDFTSNNLTLFKKQFFKEHDLRGSYYRFFRKGMLDDAGAPVLPFIEYALANGHKKYDAIIKEMANYVMTGQSRMPDGTLCRPEPKRWTIWADDLFMSVPMLVKYGSLHNQEKYYDEAVRQIINFNKYLYDSGTKLYKHGWFKWTNSKSDIYWGRANGWIIWATTEALNYLPKTHQDYNRIKEILKNHLYGILTYQDKSGMWHQILDDNTSFEESSCTAMFIIGLSSAIRNGLLDKKYSLAVFNAWNALQKNISGDGIVKDICCGTGIGDTAEFYKMRDRYNNDPRGLGSVIVSAIEVDRLQRFLNN